MLHTDPALVCHKKHVVAVVAILINKIFFRKFWFSL